MTDPFPLHGPQFAIAFPTSTAGIINGPSRTVWDVECGTCGYTTWRDTEDEAERLAARHNALCVRSAS